MARYDDGGIQFAEDTFAKSRAYKEKQAKKQEKFSRNLFALDTLVKGANFLINQRAEEADARMLPQKANYQAYNTKALDWRTREDERVKSGKSVERFLEDMYFDEMKTELSGNDAYKNLSANSYMSYLKDEAKKMAKANADEYNAIIAAATNIPDFEDFTAFYEDQADVPRNLFSWITKGTKKILKRETEETIKYKNKKSEDALYGTKMYDKYKNLEAGLRAYEIAYGEGKKATDILDDLAEKNLLRGDYAGPENDIDTFKIRIEDGIIYKDKVKHLSSYTPDGRIQYRPEDAHVWATVEVEVLEDEKSGMIGASSDKIENFFKLIKPEFHSYYEFMFLEQGPDGQPQLRGSIPIEVYNKAKLYAGRNPHHYIMDGANEENLTEALQNFSQIIYAGLMIDANDNFSVDAYGNYNTKFDSTVRTNDKGETFPKSVSKFRETENMYYIIDDYRKTAAVAGLDLNGIRMAFENVTRQSNTKPVENKEGEEFKNSTSLVDIVPQENRQSWIGYTNDIESDLYNIFDIPKLISEQGTDKRYILLKDIDGNTDIDLNLTFNDFGFPENLTHTLYFDIKTNSIVIKK